MSTSTRSNPHHSSTAAPSRVIFIGNIPFEVTEEQLVDIFKEVGPVQSIRLMFDRETGRSRGYAFCEYADAETAASAIRNLSGYELAGRNLKVDKADNDMLPSSISAGSNPSYRPDTSSTTPSSSATASSHQHHPQRKPVQNLSNYSTTPATTAIHNILNAQPFTNPQTLMEVLASMKGTIQSNPEQMRHLLNANPALAYALLQSFISLGLVDMSTVQSLLVQAQHPIQSPPPPPPPNTHVSQQPTTAAASAEQQRALIMQIMSMTPEQINMLPPQQREQVIQLKQQIMNQQQQQHRAV